MGAFPFVNVRDSTWLLYVAVLVVAIYFRFTRVFTIRNLDLLLLLLISTTSILIVEYKDKIYIAADPAPAASDLSESATGSELAASSGVTTDSSPKPDDATDAEVTEATTPQKHPLYVWSSIVLLVLSVLLLIRLIFDESLTRRPRLEQNLNQAGLLFLSIPAFAILMTGALKDKPEDSTVKAMEHARALLDRKDVPVDPSQPKEAQPAPTETLIAAGGAAVAQLSGSLPKSASVETVQAVAVEDIIARALVVLAHSTVVLGLVLIGKQHFASLQLGIAMSCLYLLLPCTAANVHKLNHVLPAACLVWALASYRKPVISGILLGFASGTLFFAVFLIPLWTVFYGRRGGLRFLVSVMGVAVVLITALLMISGDASSLFNKLSSTANWTVYRLLDDSMPVDSSVGQLFVRIPMAAIFFVMLTAMTVLPRPRNLENLLANSTCLVVAAQLWYPDDIGSYVLWYLPLFLLVIFRPRLDRFTPPEIVGRQAEAVTAGTPASPSSSTVAMNRLSLFGK